MKVGDKVYTNGLLPLTITSLVAPKSPTKYNAAHGPWMPVVVAFHTLRVACRNRKIHGPLNAQYSEFIGRSEAACKKIAHAAGWIFHKDRTATCKACLTAHPAAARIKGRKK